VFEKVSYESRYEGIVWYAFQDTVIVKDVKTARKYMVGARLVTTDGDIFEANGAITGGYQDRSRSSADTEQKIIQLSAKIREISAELEEINSVIPTVESQFETVSQQLREGSRDEGARNSEMQQLKKISTEGRPQIENIQVTITEMSDKLKELDNEIRKLEEKYGQITQYISAVESDKNGLFDKIKELSPKYAEKEERLDDEIASLRSKESEFSSEITKIDLDISHLRDRVSESTEKISNMAQESAELTKQLRNTQDNLLIENDELAKLRAVEADISQRSKEIVNALNEVGSEIRRIQDSLDTERANLSTGRGMLLSIELKIEGLEAKSREITSEMSAIDGKILTDMRSLTEIKREMEDCNREISQLGPVNQKAIEEYAEVSKDLDDLIREVEGLSSEKLELEMLTEKLNEQKKHVLLDMYNAINENMKLIYHEISGGGEAYLEMSDVNNPLESEMHIKAKPKGTNFSKIEALSGGEKSLTALSFILAVQRINPSPVYYLDEVDMFLDGANAERVGKMFRANSDNSQVLAVSLRKAMLKYADNVVGVTSFDDENTEVFEKSVESEMGVVK
jgi:chromosome segregation protein